MLPVSLEIENFQSHCHSFLEFDFNSALIIGINDEDERLSNGAGKSAILEAISYCLFNKTKNKNKDDVVRRGASLTRVELIFLHNDRKYRVVRSHNVKSSSMEVEFEEILPNGEVINKNQDTNTLTNKEIQKTISSNYNVFINSSYFRQGQGFDFAEGTFSSRQELISSLLDLNRWSDYQEEAKTRYKERFKDLDKIKADVEKRDFALSKLESVTSEIDALSADKRALEKRAVLLADQTKDLEQKLSSSWGLMDNIYQYRSLEREIESSKGQIESIESDLTSLNEQLRAVAQDLKESEEAKDGIEDEITKIKELLDVRRPIDLDSMENKIIEGKAKHTTIAKQVDNLKDNDECLMCGHSWDDEEAKSHEIHRRQEYLNKVDEMLSDALASFDDAKLYVKETESLELQVRRLNSDYKQLSEHIKYYTLKKTGLESNIKLSQERLDALTESLSALEGRLEGLEEIKGIEDLEPLESMLSERRKELDAVREEENNLLYRIGVLSGEQKGLNELIDEYGDLDSKLKDATHQVSVLGKLTKIFSRDGVPAIIIDNVIEELTRTINEWLAEFCTEPTHIHFVTQKKNSKGDWRETLDIEIHTPSGVCRFESLSGGEKFRVGFAIRLALSILQARRMGGEMQMLLLDEVSSSLDVAGLDAFLTIIRKLEREMKVLVITHDDKLKDEFETVITVRKNADVSRIER